MPIITSVMKLSKISFMVDLLEEDFDSYDLLPVFRTQLYYDGLWPHELIKNCVFYDYISKSLWLHNYTVEWFWINEITW